MKLFHANFEMKRINKEEQTATINPILLQYNQSMKKWYRKHLRSIKHGKGTCKIKIWKVPKPTEELIKLYEEQKLQFTSNLNKEIEEKLGSLDSDGKLKKEPAALSERPLTINQSKVLECLKKGMSSPNEIAKVTGILPPNVSSNINSLYQKGYKIVFTANSYSLIGPTPVGSNLNSMPAEKMAAISSIEQKELNERK
jgi:predicted transcriptional regulator